MGRSAHSCCDDEETDRHDQDQCDVGDRYGALRDQTHDHRENHQAEHIVGDCRGQHRARFDGRRQAESLKTRAVIPTLVAASAAPMNRTDCRYDRVRKPPRTRRPWDDHAHACDGQRGSPDRTEAGEVHLHTDTQQEQDHAELAEDVEGLVGSDEAQDGRPDDHTGDDLAHDRGHIDPFGDLSGQLCRDEDDADVEEDCADVHGVRSLSAGAVCIDALEDVAASPYRADFKSQGTDRRRRRLT